MPEVRVIPPVAERAHKLRVAAYARVSSDSADQLNSFAVHIVSSFNWGWGIQSTHITGMF